MAQRYQEKVGQWENSQEALDQMTDELQANQNLLWETQQKADHLKGLIGSLQEQVDTHKQQVRTRMDTLHSMQTEYINAGKNTQVVLDFSVEMPILECCVYEI